MFWPFAHAPVAGARHTTGSVVSWATRAYERVSWLPYATSNLQGETRAHGCGHACGRRTTKIRADMTDAPQLFAWGTHRLHTPSQRLGYTQEGGGRSGKEEVRGRGGCAELPVAHSGREGWEGGEVCAGAGDRLSSRPALPPLLNVGADYVCCSGRGCARDERGKQIGTVWWMGGAGR